MVQYAFPINSDACSGCKTCQVACKDKHDLPVGVYWRKVYEVTSGEWTRKESAWASDVAAYNLSTSCHHCQNPVCIPPCPVNAIWKAENGIVLIDENSCRNCKACEMACPYGAIRFNSIRNTTTKCTFCVDLLIVGAPPACQLPFPGPAAATCKHFFAAATSAASAPSTGCGRRLIGRSRHIGHGNRRAAIHARLKRNGATAVWVYAPGYIGEKLSVADMQALTGIRLAENTTAGELHVDITDYDHPYTKSLARGSVYGTDVNVENIKRWYDHQVYLKDPRDPSLRRDLPGFRINPRFYGDDAQAKTLGKLAGVEKPGLTRKTRSGTAKCAFRSRRSTAALPKRGTKCASTYIARTAHHRTATSSPGSRRWSGIRITPKSSAPSAW